MALKFSDICALLDDLETIEKKDVPLLRQGHRQVTRRIIDNWFKKHRATLDAPSSNGVAVLSTLFPERRTDRVYGLQETRLCNVFARCLFLGTRDAKRLQEYRIPGKGDLGTCLERIQKVHDDDSRRNRDLSVDEVDSLLEQLAAKCRFSSPEMRSRRNGAPFEEQLTVGLKYMRASEMKWLTRLMLKDLTPITLDYDYVLRSFHFLLPSLLRFQDNFEPAVRMLQGPLKRYHANPDLASQTVFKKEAALMVKPRVGVKVGAPTFHKARSIEHCLKLANGKRWGVERKYDGEYCEVHVDLQDNLRPIKLFSKAGKDATEDRHNLMPALHESLRIGSVDSAISQQCILVGEVVVFSDRIQQILPFHAIRKLVPRSGRLLGTDEDSPPHADEHLMIIFFDILLLDDEVTLVKPHIERRKTLNRVVKKISGRAMTSEWKTIDFSMTGSTQTLLHNFAASVVQRHEGLLLKPADASYFSLLDDEPGSWHSGFIKMKEDYMEALGGHRDVADFLIIGASYNVREAQRSNLKNVRATRFHLACLTNTDAIRFERMPVLKVVESIGSDACIGQSELEALNNIVRFHSRPFQRHGDGLEDPSKFQISLPRQGVKIDVILDTPIVVEVLGSGFVKPPNSTFWMLRHPRILKVHLDRGWRDATSFTELQDMADAARTAPSEGGSQELADIVKELKRKLQRKADSGTLRSSLTPRSPASAKRSTTTWSPATTRGTISPRSPLAPRRDNGNARAQSSPLAKRSAVSLGQACSPISCTRHRSVGGASLHTPPTSSALMEDGKESHRKTNPSASSATGHKRQASSEHHGREDLKRRKPERGIEHNDSNVSGGTDLTATTKVPKCSLGDHCRWSSANAVFYLAPTVQEYGILLDKPGLIPIHGGEILNNNELASWQGARSNGPDGDVVHDSQEVALRLVVLLEPLRLDECLTVQREVNSLALVTVEFWDWRVMELHSCLDWTESITAAPSATDRHSRFIWPGRGR